MLPRNTRRKLSGKVKFQLALSCPSSPTTMPASSPSGRKFRKPNAPLKPQVEDDYNLHPQSTVRGNLAHSRLPKELRLRHSLRTPSTITVGVAMTVSQCENVASCSVDTANPFEQSTPHTPVCEKPSTPAFEEPFEEPDLEFFHDASPPDFDYNSQHCRKKDNQYRHWQNEVIPILIEPYLDILRQTSYMRLPLPEPQLPACQCAHGRHPLKVLGVSWTSECDYFAGVKVLAYYLLQVCRHCVLKSVNADLHHCNSSIMAISVLHHFHQL